MEQTLEFSLATKGLQLRAREAPWDSAIYGFPVVQLLDFFLIDFQLAVDDFANFRAWLSSVGVGIVSCRLIHDRLRESMFLESQGFRFVEMVLHPTLNHLARGNYSYSGLDVLPASEQDMPMMVEIAESAFGYERYHIDPRLDARLGDLRYGQWVRSSYSHPTQELLKVLDGDRLVGLFIVEIQADDKAYWHLTAVSPKWQKQGYGRRVWKAMLRYHQDSCCVSVATTISARNIPVLNLYSQLNFRFLPPEMTFHWINGDE